MNEELKPCPFCGSEDVFLEDASDKNGELWVVGCNKCFVAFSAGSESSEGCADATREETIAAWNRRAE